MAVLRDSGNDAVDQLRLVLLQDMAHHFRVHLELHIEEPVRDLLRIKHTGISDSEVNRGCCFTIRVVRRFL